MRPIAGEIVHFEDFLAMDAQGLSSFDVILGAFVGKWGVLKRCALWL